MRLVGETYFFLVSKRIYETYFPKTKKGHFDYYSGRYPLSCEIVIMVFLLNSILRPKYLFFLRDFSAAFVLFTFILMDVHRKLWCIFYCNYGLCNQHTVNRRDTPEIFKK